MNKVFRRLASIIGAVAAASITLICSSSCEKLGFEPGIGIDASPELFNTTAESGSYQFKYSSYMRWKARTDQPWLKISRSSGGSGPFSLSFSVEENTDPHERVGNLIFESKDLTRKIEVVQHGGQVILGADAASYSVESTGAVLDIGIESNVEYKVSIQSDAVWIKEDKGSGNGKLRLIVDKNENITSRIASVALISTEKNVESTRYNIMVQQSQKDSVWFIQDFYHVPYRKGEVRIWFESNVKGLTIESDSDWISYSKEMGMNPLFVSIDENTSEDKDYRDGHLIFKGKNMQKAVTIRQYMPTGFNIIGYEPDYIHLYDNIFKIRPEANDFTLHFDCKLDFTASGLPKWLSIRSTDNRSYITFHAEEFHPDTIHWGRDETITLTMQDSQSLKIRIVQDSIGWDDDEEE